MSTYILAGDLGRRRPAVRRGGRARRPRAGRPAARGAPRPASRAAGPVAAELGRAPLAAVAPTPDDGRRLSAEPAWDEATRPTGPRARPDAHLHADEQAAGQHLIDVHDALRAELAQLRDLVEQVAAGDDRRRPPCASYINRMTIRQNNWTLGAYCEPYCRVGHRHHTLEDRSVFPHLRRTDAALAPVIDRLEEEHESSPSCSSASTGRWSPSSPPRTTASTGVRARHRTCSPTRCSRTSPTRSASWSSRWPGRLLLRIFASMKVRDAAREVLAIAPAAGCARRRA